MVVLWNRCAQAQSHGRRGRRDRPQARGEDRRGHHAMGMREMLRGRLIVSALGWSWAIEDCRQYFAAVGT